MRRNHYSTNKELPLRARKTRNIRKTRTITAVVVLRAVQMIVSKQVKIFQILTPHLNDHKQISVLTYLTDITIYQYSNIRQ